MKTQNTTLAFRKNAVIELSRVELFEVNGGTSAPCGVAVAGAAIGAAGAVVGGLIVVANNAGVAVGEAISRAVD